VGTKTMPHLYECGICDGYHPWTWNGDCRDDANRFGAPEDYEDARGMERGTAVVVGMSERVAADEEG